VHFNLRLVFLEMKLDSISFLFYFLPIFILIYFVAPQKLKNAVLFLGSLFFCAYGSGILAVLLLATVVLDYFCGRFLGKGKEKNVAVFYIAVSVAAHLGCMYYSGLLLGTTTYSVIYACYHLMAVAYVFDCYKKKIMPQKNLIHYGAFALFFPVLQVGPILRYTDVEERLTNRQVSVTEIQNGIKKMIRGLAKKVILAGHLQIIWQSILDISPNYVTTAHTWIGVIALAMSYYYTLSGYSDMAIGLAEILGFQIPENFNYPLLARSVTEFFSKYCITLMHWFRDYIYEFIGGTKEKVIHRIPATLATGFVIGIFLQRGSRGILVALWFALWIILEDLFLGKVMKLLPSVVRFCYTHAVVMIGLLVLTLPTLDASAAYLEKMFLIGYFHIYNNSVLYLLLRNVVWLTLSVLAALPIFHKMTIKMKHATTGGRVGLYRILDKLIPAFLLVMSMIYLGIV